MTCNILIVDDSKLARMAVAKGLRGRYPDWTRLEAANADEAIALVKTSRVDVALLDFNMPGRDGLVLAAELRELKPDLPIAIISANYQQEVVQRAKDVGATFLAKPVTDENLNAFLETATAKVQAGQK